jgi:DinB superfamily
MSMTSHAISSSPRPPSGELALLITLLDECYERKAWHGPNLKGSIRGLSALEANWRPRPDRHSIADNVVHAAYWKYAVRRRLTGEKRGSFRLKGSNWFPLPIRLNETDWKGFVALLDDEHRSLREAIAAFPPEKLYQLPAGGKATFISQIYGIALHDVYHAGQIQLLKRMQLEPPVQTLACGD